MRCEEVREILTAAPDGDSLAVRRHLSRCPGCRAEAARYESLLRSYQGLRTVTAEPPRGLLASLQTIPQERGRLDDLRTHVDRHRRAYAGAAAALVATGAAGAVLWRSRRAATA